MFQESIAFKMDIHSVSNLSKSELGFSRLTALTNVLFKVKQPNDEYGVNAKFV